MVVDELEGTPVRVTLNADFTAARVAATHRGRLVTTTYSDYGDLNDSDHHVDIFYACPYSSDDRWSDSA